MVSAVDSAVYGALFSDPGCAALFADAADVAAMVRVEAALARVQGRLGVIPRDAAAAIDAALDGLAVDPAGLADGTAGAGVPIPPLVAALRAAVGGEAGRYVHWGATSQDVVDTGLVLRLRDLLDVLDGRLAGLCARLVAIARAHRATVLAARTRSQQATPTTFGLKAAGWLAALHADRRRLAELRPRLLVVQFGGASGNLAALERRGIEVMEALAAELGLGAPPAPWHTRRDAIAELAGWLALVAGSAGKIGLDVVQLARTEVAEVRPGAGGGSSTMPQKSNPIAAEALVSLARFNAGLLATVHEGRLQEHERDGIGWNLEWLALPQMAVAAGAALRHADALCASLVVDAGRMRENLDRSGGLVLAEAAVFALATHVPRPDAQALVKEACAQALRERRDLFEVLRERTDAPVDWARVSDPSNYVGVAGDLIDRILDDAGFTPGA